MKFLYSRTSVRYLQKLDRNVARKILEDIEKLPSGGDVIKLRGKKTENIYRLRIRKYRVIYHVEKEIIRIVKIEKWGDVYK